MGLISRLTAIRRSRPREPVNVASPEFKANPFPFYARLRAETPVVRMNLPTGDSAWLVTRYDDVAAVLKDARFIKDASKALTAEQAARQPWWRKVLNHRLFKPFHRNLAGLDPPDHTRLRGLVNKAFTPGRIEELRERIQRLADELLDNVQQRTRMDLIRAYALPIPITIIAEMLGVPVLDRQQFHQWSKTVMSGGFSMWNMLKAIASIWALLRYLRKLIKKRRRRPHDDLLSDLIRVEEAGDTLSEDELLAMLMLLLVAGHETTVNLIGNGTLALLEHPEQLEKLRNNPMLIELAVEELLRYAAPLGLGIPRYAGEDVTIAGVTIPRGEMVIPVISSANRDDQQFANADTLDIMRQPNKHLTFGLGTHFCLGAPLARLEGQIALGTLLRRLPDLRLAAAPCELRWRPGVMMRGLEALPVAFGRTRPPNTRLQQTGPA